MDRGSFVLDKITLTRTASLAMFQTFFLGNRQITLVCFMSLPSCSAVSDSPVRTLWWCDYEVLIKYSVLRTINICHFRRLKYERSIKFEPAIMTENRCLEEKTYTLSRPFGRLTCAVIVDNRNHLHPRISEQGGLAKFVLGIFDSNHDIYFGRSFTSSTSHPEVNNNH